MITVDDSDYTDRIFYVHVTFGQGLVSSIYAFIVAYDQEEALCTLADRVLEKSDTRYTIELQEVTPKNLEHIYKRAQKRHKSEDQSRMTIDFDTIPERVLDILCPQSDMGASILEYALNRRSKINESELH